MLLPLIFFLSGACGLAYEVVWTRLLGLAVGHTTYALTAVVAAFMGGLAGGSAFFGRRIERGANPLKLYAALEIGVAALALLFPVQLSLVTSLSAATGRLLIGHAWPLGLVRFVLAAAAVAPATFLMGGTLPAMVAFAAERRSGDLARHAGLLYAINTAGAVCGATAAGFFLIERFGTLETTWIAAAGNTLVAAVAYAVARQGVDPKARTVPADVKVRTTPAPASRTSAVAIAPAVLVTYGLCGFSGLALEVVWTRALVFFAGTTTYAFTSMLVVFLAGITIGSAAVSPFVGRLRSPAAWFIGAQVALALFAATSLRLLRFAAPVIEAAWPPDQSWATLVGGNFAKAAAAMAIPTLLMGVAFPLAVRLAGAEPARDPARRRTTPSSSGDGDPRAAGRVLGALYAANTIGAIGGAVLAGLVLIPALGVGYAALGAALVSLVAAAAIAVDTAGRSRARSFAAIGIAAIGTIALGASGQRLHVPIGSERLVFYEEGTTATISVLQEVTGTRTIYIDRVPVAGTDLIMLTDQKSLAHVPMLLNPSARRVLTVGFGSGGASWSFSRHRTLDRIDCLEIDPSVFHAAPHLDASNHGVWRDPRFHLILEDARNYLASTDATYDIISTDCTDLRYKSNAGLYTTDYFALCRRRLRPRGIVTVWMPLGGLGGDTFKMALRTFRSVFPHSSVWYMNNLPTHYLLLVGSETRIDVDVSAFVKGLADSQVRADLAEIRLDDPLKIASSLLLDEEGMARLAGEGPLNTDRHPLLEFQAPRLAYRDALVANLRATAAEGDASPSTAMARWRGPAALLSSLAPYVAATPPLVEGHAQYQRGTFDYPAALRLYRAAAVANSGDRSIPPLIADVQRTQRTWLDEFGSRTAAGSTDPRDWLAWSTLLRQAGRRTDAVGAARKATELAPASGEARVKLAAALAASGDERTAVETLEQGRHAAKNDPVVLTDLGAAYNEQEAFEAAADVLREAIAQTPNAADAHNNLGVALNGLKRPAEAVRVLQRALALNRASAEAWFNLGVAYAALGQFDRARIAYGQGLALAPGEPRALYNLGLIEAQAGRLNEAARRLREAVDRQPQSAEYRNELGRLYLRLNDPGQAVSAFERARALDPSSDAIAENLRLANELKRAPAHHEDAKTTKSKPQ